MTLLLDGVQEISSVEALSVSLRRASLQQSTRDVADHQERLARALYQTGQYELAAEACKRAHKVWQVNSERVCDARALAMAGVCYYDAGAVGKADDMFKRAENTAKEAGDATLMLTCTHNRALALLQSGRPEAAVDTLMAAHEVATAASSQGGTDPLSSTIAESLAACQLACGRHVDALRALSGATTAVARTSAACALLCAGDAARAQREFLAALSQLSNSTEAAALISAEAPRSAGVFAEARVAYHVGEARRRSAQLVQAMESFEEAAATLRVGLGTVVKRLTPCCRQSATGKTHTRSPRIAAPLPAPQAMGTGAQHDTTPLASERASLLMEVHTAMALCLLARAAAAAAADHSAMKGDLEAALAQLAAGAAAGAAVGGAAAAAQVQGNVALQAVALLALGRSDDAARRLQQNQPAPHDAAAAAKPRPAADAGAAATSTSTSTPPRAVLTVGTSANAPWAVLHACAAALAAGGGGGLCDGVGAAGAREGRQHQRRGTVGGGGKKDENSAVEAMKRLRRFCDTDTAAAAAAAAAAAPHKPRRASTHAAQAGAQQRPSAASSTGAAGRQERRVAATALSHLGAAALAAGRLEEAERRFTQQAQAAAAAGDLLMQAAAARGLGDVHIARGAYAEGTQHFEAYLKLALEAQSDIMAADACKQLCALYTELAASPPALGEEPPVPVMQEGGQEEGEQSAGKEDAAVVPEGVNTEGALKAQSQQDAAAERAQYYALMYAQYASQ
ncbi:hypothetical protein JKP88DRAFT_304533 [Tribonema minus]|uniref:Uncharacterized protein n=1 Tax=Tribonema minus TaxID=303371 RepID=A0A835Z8F2_9STRA|nr:hypothetical protein JKP88DRAFT_304533 [Tribonema minus]